MRSRIGTLASSVVALAIAATASAETYWVPVAAHLPGANGTRWRTDVSVLNPCDLDVTVELRLHTAAGIAAATFEVPAGAQQAFPDVVAMLTDEDTKGALEVEADAEVLVTSRTANHSAAGTYGQGLRSVRFADAAGAGTALLLQSLREDADFRTNIGVLNTGSSAAAVTVELFDRQGQALGQYTLAVTAGRVLQDDRPFLDRFGRQDIVAGYARLTVERGSGVVAYASLVDNRTGDATTVVAEPETECRRDIALQLAGIDGMTVTEVPSDLPGYRRFELEYLQPEDHDAPDGPRFSQRLSLLHRALDTPVVLNTQGYDLWTGRTELIVLLDCNQIQVEHRFFGGSIPASGDWSLMTVRQAAADHHRIVQALAPIYGAPWLSTGYSKGGMTATYHRRFYPDDVDATVAYVAPLSLGAPDDRYLDFVANAGTPACNQALRDLQREVLRRRDEMIPRIEALPGMTFDRIGGADHAFESTVIEVPFSFWQYAGQASCSRIPATSADDQRLFDFVDFAAGWVLASDLFMDAYDAYFFQAQSELGYPAVARDHLADLLRTDAVDAEGGLPPPGTDPVFDPAAMPDIAQWVATEGERLLFVYGEWDPWTGGAYDLGNATDSYLYVVAGGTHSASIGALEPDDRQAAVDAIARWAGVATTKRLPAPVDTMWPPWRRGSGLTHRPGARP